MAVNPNQDEIDESVNALRNYRDRLKAELTNVSQKLRMPQNKIDLSLKENSELQKIENALSKLLKESQKPRT